MHIYMHHKAWWIKNPADQVFHVKIYEQRYFCFPEEIDN